MVALWLDPFHGRGKRGLTARPCPFFSEITTSAFVDVCKDKGIIGLRWQRGCRTTMFPIEVPGTPKYGEMLFNSRNYLISFNTVYYPPTPGIIGLRWPKRLQNYNVPCSSAKNPYIMGEKVFHSRNCLVSSNTVYYPPIALMRWNQKEILMVLCQRRPTVEKTHLLGVLQVTK